MKKYTDHNFLDGKLTIISKPEKNLTLGRLVTYDPDSDTILNFNAFTKCNPNDEYNIYTGYKIIKLKLAKQYYAYIKKHNLAILNEAKRTTNSAQAKLNYANKKLIHIKYELENI